MNSESGVDILEMKDIRCVAYEAAVPIASRNVTHRRPYSKLVWQPDIDFASETLLDYSGSAADIVAAIVGWAHHKQPLASVLIVGDLERSVALRLFECAPPITILHMDACSADFRIHAKHVLSKRVTTDSTSRTDGLIFEKHRMNIIGNERAENRFWRSRAQALQHFDSLLLLSHPSHQVASQDAHADLPERTRSFTYNCGGNATIPMIRCSDKFERDCVEKVIVLIEDTGRIDSTADRFVKAVSKCCSMKLRKLLKHDGNIDGASIVLDLEGRIMEQIDPASFDALPTLLTSNKPLIWITAGVSQGTNT